MTFSALRRATDSTSGQLSTALGALVVQGVLDKIEPAGYRLTVLGRRVVQALGVLEGVEGNEPAQVAQPGTPDVDDYDDIWNPKPARQPSPLDDNDGGLFEVGQPVDPGFGRAGVHDDEPCVGAAPADKLARARAALAQAEAAVSSPASILSNQQSGPQSNRVYELD